MLTPEELEAHFKLCRAPISEKFTKKHLRAISRLKPGDLIWISAESFTDMPVRFLKYSRLYSKTPAWFVNSALLEYEYMHKGSRFEDVIRFYQFIRKVTTQEERDLIKTLQDELNFLTMPTTQT